MKSLKKQSTAALVLVASLISAGALLATDDTGLEVSEAWVREMPPVSKVTAGYMVIENNAAEPRVLVGGTSPLFERLELHRTVESEGVARMVEQKQVTIAAGATLTMKPGDYHVMMFGAKQALKAGDSVPLTLNLKSGARLEVTAEVRKATMGAHQHHHHH